MNAIVLFLFLLSTVAMASEDDAASSTSSSKCTESELKQFGDEYEQCHSKALQRLKAETVAYKTNPRASHDSRGMICQGLRNLIDDCTVILGWCYTAQQVEETKRRQEGLMREALKKIFADFDVEQCSPSSSSSSSSESPLGTSVSVDAHPDPRVPRHEEGVEDNRVDPVEGAYKHTSGAATATTSATLFVAGMYLLLVAR